MSQMQLAKFKLGSVHKNLIGSYYGVAVQMLHQIILVPVFLFFWGVDQYGDWIVLTAVSSFFSMSDAGLNSVSANRFAISMAEGKTHECNSLLTINCILLFAVSVVAVTGSVLYVMFGSVENDFSLHVIEPHTARFVLVTLIAGIFIAKLSGVTNAIYRATSQAYRAFFIDNTARLAEAVMLLAGIVCSLSFEAIVILYTLPRLLSLVYKAIDSRRFFRYSISIRHFDKALLKQLLFPSLSFMGFPLGNALIIQGYSLVVNHFLGAGPLVLFNTTRTMINFLKQMTAAVYGAVWPEYSIAFGKKNYPRMRHIHQNAFLITAGISLILSVFLLMFGKPVYNLWTGEKVIFSPLLTLLLLVAFNLNNCWNTSGIALMATNNHSKLGIMYVVLAVFSITMLAVQLRYIRSLELVPLANILIDAVLFIYTVRKAIQMTEDTVGAFVHSFRSHALRLAKNVQSVLKKLFR